MMENNNFNHIPKEKFQFAQEKAILHDSKLQTKPRSYFKDAWIRFRKNKSSVVAAIIIGFLILFAIVAPIMSPYQLSDTDFYYKNCPSFVYGSSILKGTRQENLSQDLFDKYTYHELETGEKIIDEIVGYTQDPETGRELFVANLQQYYKIGVRFTNVSKEDFDAIQAYQTKTGKQVLYPVVNAELQDPSVTTVQDRGFYWYQYDYDRTTRKYSIKLDDKGNPVNAYYRNTDGVAAIEYNSTRIASDDGTYVYGIKSQSGVQVRMSYFEYYMFKHNGQAPSFMMGTDVYGRDIFDSLGTGARFSLILAIVVSAINLTIGAIYGSIEGYYGGWADIIMERISDVMSGIPFIVVITLLQQHLGNSLGVIPAFLLAFVVTGWVGMAALVRKQFYRFKGQEYVLVAKSLGANDGRIMFKHIFPNSLGTIITSCALTIPSVIRSETNMTYLGIVNLSSNNLTSVGVMLSEANASLTYAPHALFWPSLFISLLLICFNLFGNGLRDAFNPSLRGSEE